jgi:hypothetical protein
MNEWMNEFMKYLFQAVFFIMFLHCVIKETIVYYDCGLLNYDSV